MVRTYIHGIHSCKGYTAYIVASTTRRTYIHVYVCVLVSVHTHGKARRKNRKGKREPETSLSSRAAMAQPQLLVRPATARSERDPNSMLLQGCNTNAKQLISFRLGVRYRNVREDASLPHKRLRMRDRCRPARRQGDDRSSVDNEVPRGV